MRHFLAQRNTRLGVAWLGRRMPPHLHLGAAETEEKRQANHVSQHSPRPRGRHRP
ncbi:MAG: hypothetical protein HUK12_07775, partial [Muribaculaceae bacterium]|nr:hypothetical protein [Muribaculaceae bacterium]